MKNRKNYNRISQQGFTLVELLVVLAIIGLITAVATPQVLRYLDSAKVSTTKTQIRNLQSALELYYLDNGKYPTTNEGLSVLVKAPDNASGWNGPYVKGANVLDDAWGNAFVYSPAKSGSDAKITSLGSDNKEGGIGVSADIEG